MNIEIRGAGFENKGAELMLRTTVERLRRRHPKPNLVLEPGINSNYSDRAALGLAATYPAYTLLEGRVRSLAIRSKLVREAAFASLRRARPRSASRTLGLIDREECDALLDIAGYAYGDKFPAMKTRVAADATAEYSRRQKPVVFLPQMFGPFSDRRGADQMRRAAASANLIYARDERSFEMLEDLIGKDDRLRLSPDITIASFGCDHNDKPAGTAPYACIVPNERMAEQGKAEWGETYLSRLQHALQRIATSDIKPIIVIHTNDPGDLSMGEELRQRVGPERVGLFIDPDPYALKAFLGGAEFMIGSRFHSIVAALSSGVPAVALGWAHKYEMLARDFGVEELQHRGADPEEMLISLVDRLSDEAENQRLRTTIRGRGAKLRSQVEVMWNDIDQLLNTVS